MHSPAAAAIGGPIRACATGFLKTPEEAERCFFCGLPSVSASRCISSPRILRCVKADAVLGHRGAAAESGIVLRFGIDDLQPWIDVRFERSSGPGGQHVNKVATRVVVQFDYRACDLLSDWQKQRIGRRLSSRLTHDGRVAVGAERARSQAANRAAAELRLLELLERALHVAKPRKATKPTAGSKRRRLADKKRRGQIKKLRGKRPSSDE